MGQYSSSINDKILEKIEEHVKDPQEKSCLREILERVLSYGTREEIPEKKREFELIWDTHFGEYSG